MTGFSSPNLSLRNQKLRQDRKDLQRCTTAAFAFHRHGVDRGSRRWQAIQVSDVRETRRVRSGDNLLPGEVLRNSLIDGRGVDAAHRFDTPLIDQELGGLFRQPGEMQVISVARGVAIQGALALAPTRTNQPEHTAWATPMGLLRGAEIAHLQTEIAILPRLAAQIDRHTGADQVC